MANFKVLSDVTFGETREVGIKITGSTETIIVQIPKSLSKDAVEKVIKRIGKEAAARSSKQESLNSLKGKSYTV